MFTVSRRGCWFCCCVRMVCEPVVGRGGRLPLDRVSWYFACFTLRGLRMGLSGVTKVETRSSGAMIFSFAFCCVVRMKVRVYGPKLVSPCRSCAFWLTHSVDWRLAFCEVCVTDHLTAGCDLLLRLMVAARSRMV